MNLFASSEKTSFSVCLIISILPFFLFYWMVPFISDFTIGNDYLRFSIREQLEILFSIKTGSFPLYIPGFAAGHSSISLTLGQFFHPLSHLASIMPGYWDGKALEWNNFLKLLSLGLTQVALFVFLRRLRLNALFSFLFSFITVYNLRMVDLFRHGAPLEAYTGHLILCVATGWYFIDPKKLMGPLCIIGATYLLVCNGHPEEMYYGLLCAGMFALVAPFYLSTMLPDKQVDFKIAFRFWIKTGLFICLGIALSSVYIFPFYFDFIKANIDRVGQSYAWADSNRDTFIGTINNFLLPFRSEANSAFGSSSLTLLAVVLPLLRLFRVKIPRSIWVTWGLLLFMFLFMQGGRTPVHKLVWEYLPFASSIRGAGRISMIMPFFLMLLLAWAGKHEPFSLRIGRSAKTLSPLMILAYIALSLTGIYYLLYVAGYYIFSLTIFHELFPYPVGQLRDVPFFWIEFAVFLSGAAVLTTLAVYRVRTETARALGILLIMLTLTQAGIVLKYRSALWAEKKFATPTFEEMQKQKTVRLDYLYYPGGGLHSSVIMSQLKKSFVEPFLGKIFTYVVPASNQEEVYAKMAQERLPQQIFVEGYNPEKAKALTEGAKDMKEGAVKLVYSSYNRLRFRVISEAPAFFGLSYPYTGHWEAWVNSGKVRIYRANGAAHAVEIPGGESFVEFRYWSNAFFWGAVISCLTFTIIGISVFSRAFKGLPRRIGIIIILTISTGGLWLWHHSFYNGENMGTEYIWTYPPPVNAPNFAYGKKNWVGTHETPLHWAATELQLYSGRFIDGDSSKCSGFTTRLYNNPAWFLDLYQIRNLKTIILYEGCRNQSVTEWPLGMLDSFSQYDDNPDQHPPVNVRPLNISISDDGNLWNTVYSVISPVNCCDPTRIVFNEPQTARFIRIHATGESKLLFDEVEVYGPRENE